MKVIFNGHKAEYENSTIEFNVRNPKISEDFPKSILEQEWVTGHFTNQYAHKLFKSLRYPWIVDWSFTGRSMGWFVLETLKDPKTIKPETLDKITEKVEKYFNNYEKNLRKYYKTGGML